jgi:hypothetical protein
LGPNFLNKYRAVFSDIAIGSKNLLKKKEVSKTYFLKQTNSKNDAIKQSAYRLELS